MISLLKVPQYFFATQQVSRSQVLVAAWSDQEFLISTTLAIVGLLTIFVWDSLFPDRRDYFVLAPLPIPLRALFVAKATALGTALAVAVVSLNIFSGIAYPFLVIPEKAGWLGPVRSLAAYWLTMAAAGLFLFCFLLSLQGIALRVLRHSHFLRFSSYLQSTAFVVIIGVYFLMPSVANPRGLTAPEAQIWLKMIPSFWFLGLFQELNGALHPAFHWLAIRALWALVISLASASTLYFAAYRSHLRRIGEQSGVAPANDSRGKLGVARFAARFVSSRQQEQAIFLFIARTLARSRPHRTLLALYGGLGLACSLAYLGELIHSSKVSPLGRPNTPLLAAGLVFLFFAIVGLRACFAFPVELRANWIFRITEMRGLSRYRKAVRASMVLLAALPLCIASAALYLSLWPAAAALAHLTVFVLTSVLPVRFIVLIAVLLCSVVLARRRSTRAVALSGNRLLFEETPKAELLSLDLRSGAVNTGVVSHVFSPERF